MWRVEFEVATADRNTVDVDTEDAARLCVEDGVVAHPGDDRVRAGEVRVDSLRRRGDVHRGSVRVRGHDCPCWAGRSAEGDVGSLTPGAFASPGGVGAARSVAD